MFNGPRIGNPAGALDEPSNYFKVFRLRAHKMFRDLSLVVKTNFCKWEKHWHNFANLQ